MDELEAKTYEVYKKAMEKGLLVGISNEIALLTCRIYASKIIGRPISLRSLDKDVRHRIYKLLTKLNMTFEPPKTDLTYYINMFDLDNDVKQDVVKIAQKLTPNGKDPKGIVGALIYVISKQHGRVITQKEISLKLDVSQVTLRHRIKEISRFLNYK